MNKKLIFSSFFLKLIALLTMTIDHVGLLLINMYPTDQTFVEIHNIFRIIGRLALPLFVFMIVEGVLHTKSIKKYLLRLGIMALIISAALIVICYAPLPEEANSLKGMGNIFIDLFLVALTVYLLNYKNWKIKLLATIPIAISFISFSVKCYEFDTRVHILWYPEWLYMQYDYFSMLLGVLFFASYKLGNLYVSYISNQSGISEDIFKENGTTRLAINLLSLLSLIIVSILYYLPSYFIPHAIFWDKDVQLFAMLSGLFILLYNGKRGYNAKWFQYGSYIYYPLSLIIIFLVFIIIVGI